MQHKILHSSLFILHPTAGNRGTDGAAFGAGAYGYYWSSGQGNATDAYYLIFHSGFQAGRLSSRDKLYGFPVRCVRL